MKTSLLFVFCYLGITLADLCQWNCTTLTFPVVYFSSVQCWTCGRLPRSQDDVVIQGGLPVQAIDSTNVGSIRLVDGAELILQGIQSRFGINNISVETNSTLSHWGYELFGVNDTLAIEVEGTLEVSDSALLRNTKINNYNLTTFSGILDVRSDVFIYNKVGGRLVVDGPDAGVTSNFLGTIMNDGELVFSYAGSWGGTVDSDGKISSTDSIFKNNPQVWKIRGDFICDGQLVIRGHVDFGENATLSGDGYADLQSANCAPGFISNISRFALSGQNQTSQMSSLPPSLSLRTGAILRFTSDDVISLNSSLVVESGSTLYLPSTIQLSQLKTDNGNFYLGKSVHKVISVSNSLSQANIQTPSGSNSRLVFDTDETVISQSNVVGDRVTLEWARGEVLTTTDPSIVAEGDASVEIGPNAVLKPLTSDTKWSIPTTIHGRLVFLWQNESVPHTSLASTTALSLTNGSSVVLETMSRPNTTLTLVTAVALTDEQSKKSEDAQYRCSAKAGSFVSDMTSLTFTPGEYDIPSPTHFSVRRVGDKVSFQWEQPAYDHSCFEIIFYTVSQNNETISISNSTTIEVSVSSLPSARSQYSVTARIQAQQGHAFSGAHSEFVAFSPDENTTGTSTTSITPELERANNGLRIFSIIVASVLGVAVVGTLIYIVWKKARQDNYHRISLD